MEALDRYGWLSTEAEIRIARASLFSAQTLARDLIAAGREEEIQKIRDDALPAPKPWTGPKRRRTAAGASVAKVEIEAAAGAGAWNEDFVQEKVR